DDAARPAVHGVGEQVALASVRRCGVAIPESLIAHSHHALEIHAGRFGVRQVAVGAGARAHYAHKALAALHAAAAAVDRVGGGVDLAPVGEVAIAVGEAGIAGEELAGRVHAADLG